MPKAFRASGRARARGARAALAPRGSPARTLSAAVGRQDLDVRGNGALRELPGDLLISTPLQNLKVRARAPWRAGRLWRGVPRMPRTLPRRWTT